GQMTPPSDHTEPPLLFLSEQLATIAELNRLRILVLLSSRGVLTIGQVADALQIRYQLAGHHLEHLYLKNIVTRQRNGKYTIYILNQSLLNDLLSNLLNLLRGDDANSSRHDDRTTEDSDLRTTGNREDEPGADTGGPGPDPVS